VKKGARCEVNFPKVKKMSGYKELEIYNISFDLAINIHHASLKLPQFELYEQGSQIRRASKSIKDNIAEGYGRRRYKAEYIRFLIFAHASCDETISQLEMLTTLYPEIKEFLEIKMPYDNLGSKINKYIQYVENNWRT
jgi:four helix bundle protein